jgi:hypothetical protein
MMRPAETLTGQGGEFRTCATSRIAAAAGDVTRQIARACPCGKGRGRAVAGDRHDNLQLVPDRIHLVTWTVALTPRGLFMADTWT